jgi:hypothetical protein
LQGRTRLLHALAVGAYSSRLLDRHRRLPADSRLAAAAALQVAGVSEIKACIKLQLRDGQDEAILVYRAFSLTQQKTKKSFKSLDGSIATRNPDTGQVTAVSKKCADMDKLVPLMMGVSKPVLEHVVFVHQEDSLWPLSESLPLKQKFDAIFAATKYTAAVAKMREVIKEKNQARACSDSVRIANTDASQFAEYARQFAVKQVIYHLAYVPVLTPRQHFNHQPGGNRNLRRQAKRLRSS